MLEVAVGGSVIIGSISGNADVILLGVKVQLQLPTWMGPQVADDHNGARLWYGRQLVQQHLLVLQSCIHFTNRKQHMCGLGPEGHDDIK